MMRAVVEARAHRYLMLERARGAARRGLRDRSARARRACCRSPSRAWSPCTRSSRGRESGSCCRSSRRSGASSILVVPVERMRPMSIVAEIKREGDDGRARAGRSSSTAPSRRARVAEPDAAPARGAARRSPTACAAGTRRSGRPTSSLEVEPGVAARAPLAAARDGRHLRPAQPRLDARHVRRAGAGGRRASGSSSARRPPAPGSSPPRPSCSGSTRSGRSAARRRSAGSPTCAGRQDRRARQRVRERGEARGLARRRDRPAGRPVRGRRRRRRRTSTRGSSSSSSPRRPSTAHDAVCRVVETLAEAEAIAPEHLVLLGDVRGAAPARCGTPAPSSSAPSSPVARRRLRDRRQPRAADGRLGALGRRARDRDVPEADDDAAADAPRGWRSCGRRSRRSRRPRACPRTPRRCGDEGALAGVPRLHLGARRPTRSRASRGSIPRRSCATTRTRRRCRCPRRGRARSRARSPRSAATRPAATTSCAARSPPTTASSPEQIVLGVGADDLILLCARCFAGPGDTIAIPAAPHLSALPHRRAARRRRGRRRRPGAHLRLPSEQPRPASCARCPTARPLVCRRGLLRVLRRDRRCRCSTTA